MSMVMVARKAILEDLKERYKYGDANVLPLRDEDSHRWYKPQTNYFYGTGEINPCPCCGKGSLRYSRSGYNGHVHGSCSEGCVRWIE